MADRVVFRAADPRDVHPTPAERMAAHQNRYLTAERGTASWSC
ncbi:MAG TPA: hypothetical protein VGN37_17105 [Actinocatenispora sp.]